MPFGPTYTIIRTLASSSLNSFFSSLKTIGDEEVPKSGPLICVATHWSGAVDPAILSTRIPYHKLHFWSKHTLFKNPILRFILFDSGNVPVDRTTKDNQGLFASTFDVLKRGEVVAIFPEGTSYTMPGITSFKDGASWAALEYAKNIRATDGTAHQLSDGTFLNPDVVLKDVTICIAGISYTEKDKYRSMAVLQFGKSISTAPYIDEFLVDPKAAVKKLTAIILESLMKVTVNANDWDTLNAATMARRILWVGEKGLPLEHLRDIGQTLVDLFSLPHPSPRLATLKVLLLSYHSSLLATRLTHYTLSSVPLPLSLDPSIPAPLPSRFRALRTLLWSTLGCIVRLPFFIVPLLVHMPIYAVGRWAGRGKREEDRAQNKIALGLVLAILTYPTMFFSAWLLLFVTPAGAMMAFGFVWLFVVYHNRIVDRNYNAFKKLLASYRVLVGIWAPVAVQELNSLGVVTLDIDFNAPSPTTSTTVDETSALLSSPTTSTTGAESGVASGSSSSTNRRSGENNIRQVLRLRIETTNALAEFINEAIPSIEIQTGSPAIGIDLEGERAKEREAVSKLIGWGARVERSKAKSRSNRVTVGDTSSTTTATATVRRPSIGSRTISGSESS